MSKKTQIIIAASIISLTVICTGSATVSEHKRNKKYKEKYDNNEGESYAKVCKNFFLKNTEKIMRYAS